MKYRILLFLVALLVGIVGFFLLKNGWKLPNKIFSIAEEANVSLPTIINGELVLPKVAIEEQPSNLTKQPRLGVISANLIPIAGQEPAKLSGIRILGEMTNMAGNQLVSGISPVIRFFDIDGKVLAQKIGHLSTGWDFFGVAPGEKTLYDVTVDDPPTADKLEIVLNAAAATDSATFEILKIASRAAEIKTATYQGEATDSAGEKVEYYTISGGVVNTLTDPISDISVYAWARDKDNKVFAFARQDFKNDLLTPGEKVDFRITLLPLKSGAVYDSYEVVAWGKRYRLNL